MPPSGSVRRLQNVRSKKGINSVVFDRRRLSLSRPIKALTDAAREAGLNKNELAAREEEASEARTEENVEAKAQGKARRKTKEKQ